MAKFITHNNYLPVFEPIEKQTSPVVGSSVREVLTEEDMELCFDIRRHVFVTEQKFPTDFDTDRTPNKLHSHWLATCDISGDDMLQHIPVGTIRLTALSETVGKVSRVAVISEARGHSIGRKLMLEVMQEARRRGMTTIVLEAQTHARLFYEKLGFTVDPQDEDGFLFEHVHHITMWNRTIAD